MNILLKLTEFWRALEFFQFSTRLNRKKYCYLTIFWWLIFFIAFFLSNSLLTWIILFILIGPNLIALNFRRLNDLNISGLWSLLIIIPFLALTVVIIPSNIFYGRLAYMMPLILFLVLIIPGSKTKNKYGEPPE